MNDKGDYEQYQRNESVYYIDKGGQDEVLSCGSLREHVYGASGDREL